MEGRDGWRKLEGEEEKYGIVGISVIRRSRKWFYDERMKQKKAMLGSNSTNGNGEGGRLAVAQAAALSRGEDT